MVVFLALVAAVFLTLFIVAHLEGRRRMREVAAARGEVAAARQQGEREAQRGQAEAQAEIAAAQAEVASWRRYAAIPDAEAYAAELVREARAQADACRQAAQQDVARFTSDAAAFRAEAQGLRAEAQREAAQLLGVARTTAQREAAAMREEAAAAAHGVRAAAERQAAAAQAQAATTLATTEARAGELLRAAETHATRERAQADASIARLLDEAGAAAASLRAAAEQELATARDEATRLRDAAQHEAAHLVAARHEAAAATAALILAAAEAEAGRLRAEAAEQAAAFLAAAAAQRATAARQLEEAETRVATLEAEIGVRAERAAAEAGRLVTTAQARAEGLAGEAFAAWADQTRLEQAVSALHRFVQAVPPLVSGEGTTASDCHRDSPEAQALQRVRHQIARLAGEGLATACAHRDTYARELAERTVREAFDARVDALLERARPANAAALVNEIREAARRVNLNGQSLHGAQVCPGYVEARLEELRAVLAWQALRQRTDEEQHHLRSSAARERGSVFLLLQAGAEGMRRCRAWAASDAAGPGPGDIVAVIGPTLHSARLAVALDAHLASQGHGWPGAESLSTWATEHGTALRLTLVGASLGPAASGVAATPSEAAADGIDVPAAAAARVAR